MTPFGLHDAVELSTRERLRRFRRVVSDIFVQDWHLTSSDLAPEPMWVAGDEAEGLSIIRGYTQPMSATSVLPRASRQPTYFALTSIGPIA